MNDHTNNNDETSDHLDQVLVPVGVNGTVTPNGVNGSIKSINAPRQASPCNVSDDT